MDISDFGMLDDPLASPAARLDASRAQAIRTGDDDAGLAAMEAACERACSAIAPAWPLDRTIAVNPHWGRIHRPVRQVAARLAVLGDIQVLPGRDLLRDAWHSGRMTMADLQAALASPRWRGMTLPTAAHCLDTLMQPPRIDRLPLLIDLLDDAPDRAARLPWRQAVTHQVSQTCAAYFDTAQADWQPDRSGGLYAFWRRTLDHDHGIGVLMNLPDLSAALPALPPTRQAAERWAMERLALPEAAWADYLEAVLLTVNGWASWCAYLGWQAGLEGRQDAHLRDLLAIRLAWGALLLECAGDAAAGRAFANLHHHWAQAATRLADAEQSLLPDEVWQLALEIGYQRRLAEMLGAGGSHGAARTPARIQAAFCIDVRSEPLRRALEATSPAIRTLGFAGFFGLPVAYTPLATAARRPQLPGLLAPSMAVEDRVVPSPAKSAPSPDTLRRARRRRFAWQAQWRAQARWPGAMFPFVEAAGLAYLGKLSRWLEPGSAARPRDDLHGLPARHRAACRPALAGLDIQAQVTLAAGVLHAMGLDRGAAPLVLLIGHGSQSANNAHAAGLECGACCGQTGEVNARVLARLLNDPEVRRGLAERGVRLSPQTTFVAGLHNTTTDEIEWADADLLPAHAMPLWSEAVHHFALAAQQVRRERAPALGLDPHLAPGKLLAQLRKRANDGAQTRPEWGLAGNAAFIIGPRQRTRGLPLAGRAFLHDYDAANDADGSVLELLMTAPMLVTHWINWQYHASTCDPQHLGSGNKLLHNVVGGHIGVFEGNGGDLRIGLPQQSLHDGERWMHEPLRLTVVIEAPVERIERVIERHAVVRDLVGNGWLHLWHLDDGQLREYLQDGWAPLELENT